MKILALDSSTKRFSLVLMESGKIIASRNIILDKVLSSSITPAIQGILKKSKWDFKSLDGIAVGLGPGSFTSLRVGLATAKALGFSLNIPLVGISSLDVIACAVGPVKENICVIVDARRDLLYAAVYRKERDGLKRLGEYMLISFKDLVKTLKGKVMFVGDAVALHQKEIGKIKDFQMAKENTWLPQAKHLASLAQKNFSNKEYGDSETLVPVYLYPENCQVQK